MARRGLFERKSFATLWHPDFHFSWSAQVEDLVEAVQDCPVFLQRLLAEQRGARAAFNHWGSEGTLTVGTVSSTQRCRKLTIPEALLSPCPHSSDCHGRTALLLGHMLSRLNCMRGSLAQEVATDEVAPRSWVN